MRCLTAGTGTEILAKQAMWREIVACIPPAPKSSRFQCIAMIIAVTLSALVIAVAYVGRRWTAPIRSHQVQAPGLSQVELPPNIKAVFSPSLSPTASEVVFIGKESEVANGIYLVNLDTGAVSETVPTGTFYPLAHPNWSPDGKTIAFSGYSPREQKSGIWVLVLGFQPNFVTSGQEAVWSPDGAQLGVLAATGEGAHEINLVNVGTGKSNTIYRTGAGMQASLSDLAWSPDGNTLAFVVEVEQGGFLVRHLYRLNVDGTKLVPLAGSPQHSVAEPEWVMGSNWIAFLGGSGIDYRLRFAQADGKCEVSPFEELGGLTSIDLSGDGQTGVAASGISLVKLDFRPALAPRSLKDILVCP